LADEAASGGHGVQTRLAPVRELLYVLAEHVQVVAPAGEVAPAGQAWHTRPAPTAALAA